MLPPVAVHGVQIGVVALLSVAPAAEQGVGSLSALAVFAVVFTGIACSAVALPLQLWGQQRIPRDRAALILLAEPVFAGDRRATSTASGSARRSWSGAVVDPGRASWCRSSGPRRAGAAGRPGA